MPQMGMHTSLYNNARPRRAKEDAAAVEEAVAAASHKDVTVDANFLQPQADTIEIAIDDPGKDADVT